MSTVALVFLAVPSVDTAFLLLTSAAVILYCAMYLMLFASAIRLRYSEPDTSRPYHVPGGSTWGLWLAGFFSRSPMDSQDQRCEPTCL